MSASERHIRLTTVADAAAINDILNRYVTGSTVTFHMEPFSLEYRIESLTDRAEGHPATVVEIGGRIIGYGALGTFRAAPAYARSVELSVYVHPEFHRRGIGRAILADLIARARAHGHHALIAGCCTENTASIALLEAVGFAHVGCFREVGRKCDR